MSEEIFVGKHFYLPGYHRIVYCHETIGKDLIFGSLCEFVNDSKTSILRQQISSKKFKTLRAIELDLSKLSEYSFLTDNRLKPQMISFGVVPRSQRTGKNLRWAKQLP